MMPKEMIKGQENITEIKAPNSFACEVSSEKNEPAEVENSAKSNDTYYCLVLASRITKRNANLFTQMMKDKGYSETEYWQTIKT